MNFKYEIAKDVNLKKEEYFFALILLFCGIYLRFHQLSDFEGGELTSDERYSSFVHVYRSLFAADGYIGSAWRVSSYTIDTWNQLWGFSVLKMRILPRILGIFGVCGYFLFLREVLSQRIAIWSCLLLLTSIYANYFSRLLLEHYWILFLVPWILYFISKSYKANTIPWAVAAGIFTGIGLFTYPGFLLFALSLGSSIFLGNYIASPAERRPIPRKLVAGFVISLVVSIAFVAGPPFLEHGRISLPYYGGGSMDLSISSALVALSTILLDLLVVTKSWILPYDVAFVEWTSLPLFFIGTFHGLRRRNTFSIICFCTIVLAILLACFSGAYPGMRRVLGVLLPYYVLVAIGLEISIHWIRCRYKSMGATAAVTSLLLFLWAHPIWYQFARAPGKTRYNFGTGMKHQPLPMDWITETLQTSHILLFRSEFNGNVEGIYYEALSFLGKRYKRFVANSFSIFVVSDDFSFESLENWVLLTNNKDKHATIPAKNRLHAKPGPGGFTLVQSE